MAEFPANCRDDDEPREMLSCKFIVMQGMEVSEMSQELRWCLRSNCPRYACVFVKIFSHEILGETIRFAFSIFIAICTPACFCTTSNDL